MDYHGSKYDVSRTPSQIVEAIRRDIKTAQTQGALPKDLRVSVVKDEKTTYPTITLRATQASYTPFSEEALRVEDYLSKVATSYRAFTTKYGEALVNFVFWVYP